MNFQTLQTKVASWLQRDDLSNDRIPDFINLAMRMLEADPTHNWKATQHISTGAITSSSDSIAIPARFKCIEAIYITVSGKRRRLKIFPYGVLMERYPYDNNVKGIPNAVGVLDTQSKIYFRPYPDATYTYELIYHAFSPELSSPSDTNWWTDNLYGALLYGALLQGEAYVRNPEDLVVWRDAYMQIVERQKAVERLQVYEGSSIVPHAKTHYVK